ncbi:hypothetical protein NC652_016493 [Populus alba x Populus x berolinensis]|nr:hypothetical protein NC652_016493 [Populus alba x Populus x berolinensis]
MRDRKNINSIDTETIESVEFLDLSFSEIPRKPSIHRERLELPKKKGKQSREDKSQHILRQESPTRMNFGEDKFKSERQRRERRLGMLKFRVRRKYVIYTCFRGRGRLCEL